jgi:hypothetical protein
VNYTELVSIIRDYTENDEATFVANIPVFVKNAERRIFHAAQLLPYRLNKSSAFTAGSKYLALPDDFLFPYSFAVVDYGDSEHRFLLEKDVNYLREAYPDPDYQAQPRFYALFDMADIIVAPTPDQSYTCEMHYAAYPESIVTAGTTWLGDNFEHVLQYGALVEAYTFMKGEKDLLDRYDTQFKEGLMMLKQYGDGKTRHDAYRSGQARLPNT